MLNIVAGLALGTISGVGTLVTTGDGALAAIVALIVIVLVWFRIWAIIIPTGD